MRHLIHILLIISSFPAFSQTSLSEMQPSKDYDNILVEKLTTDERASCFVIWIKESVRPHKHEHHSENLYVIEGEAEMKLGEESILIKPGDYITIPQGTVHSVKVTSEVPLKVLSVQAPEFLGKDRVFVE